ncbi:cytochrome P450 [Actinosynnema sp. NPDC004786]
MPDTVPGLDLADQPTGYEALTAWWAHMRDHAPVRRDRALGHWHVFRYADAVTVLTDHETWSSDLRSLVRQPEQFSIVARGAFNGFDPPDHRRLRGLVSKAFTPRVVAELEPVVRRITRDLLDAARGEREVELIDALAYPLPLAVIAELMRVPLTDRERFRRWADALFYQGRGDDPVIVPTEEMLLSVEPLIGEMNAYFLDVIAERRRRPGDDLISGLVLAEDGGQRLADEEVLGVCGFLLVAGHITTTMVLGNAVHLLATRPDAAAALRAEPATIPAAVEEVLRLRGQLPATARRATRDAELGGFLIPEGDVVLVWVASANLDERRFPDADRFRPDRSPNQHLALGRGIHFCIGAPLARLEQRVALEELLAAWRDFRLGDNVEFVDPRQAIGLRRLPIRPVWTDHRRPR